MSAAINDGGPAAVIPVSGGVNALVSNQDTALVSCDGWRLGLNGYVYRRGGRIKGRPCLLHRIVLGAGRGVEVHHINGIKTDCRRENLEATTASKHQEYHMHRLVARNRASRIYPLTGTCKSCGSEFTRNPDHRSRQVCCSKACAIQLAVAARKGARHGNE